jgi:DNA-binding CsgD family transcriptional regulator
MSIFQRFRRWWIGQRQNRTITYALDDPIHQDLLHIAAQVNRPTDEVNSDVLALGLGQIRREAQARIKWDVLSPREQQVCARICLGDTNRQIAARLGLSEQTVRSYLQTILVKLQLHGKAEVRVLFSVWDFDEWDTATGG